MLQKTIRKTVSLEGIGLHSGRQTRLTLRPASPGEGIRFVRVDLEGQPSVRAQFSNISSTRLATTLGSGRLSVATVEHVMAALRGSGVDNAIVEIDGPEVPVLDGSAKDFSALIQAAGTEAQLQHRTLAYLKKRIEVKIEDKWAVAEPSNRFEIHASIEWDHPVIGYQEYHFTEGKSRFSEICDARTFGFLRDVESMKRLGLAQGGSLNNAILLDDARVLNEDGLRYSDEFVRHKVLDALGDLSLAGVSLVGAFRLHRAGHDLHHRLLVSIFRDASNYELIRGPAVQEQPAREEIPVLAG